MAPIRFQTRRKAAASCSTPRRLRRKSKKPAALGETPNIAGYLHGDGILGVRKLACAFDWARLNGSNNLSVTPEGCSKLQHSKAPSAQKQKTCGIRRDAGAPSKPRTQIARGTLSRSADPSWHLCLRLRLTHMPVGALLRIEIIASW